MLIFSSESLLGHPQILFISICKIEKTKADQNDWLGAIVLPTQKMLVASWRAADGHFSGPLVEASGRPPAGQKWATSGPLVLTLPRRTHQ